MSFCVVGAPVQQRMHVALVGGHAVEDPGPETRLARLGLDHGQLDVSQPHATPLDGHVGQPEPSPFGFLAQLQNGHQVLAARGDPRFVVEPLDRRLHRVADEGSDAGTDLLVLWGKGEVDGHVVLPMSSASVEADDVAMFVDIDPLGRRAVGEPGHGAHVAADQIDEAGTHVGPRLTHG